MIKIDHARAAASKALAAYKDGGPADAATNIADLVTDLMHLAARKNLDPYALIETAAGHFASESHGDAAMPARAILKVSVRQRTPGGGDYDRRWTDGRARTRQTDAGEAAA